MKRNIVKTLAAAAVVAFASGAVQAQQLHSTDFEVKVKIVDGCSVTLTGGDVVFSNRTQIYNDYRDAEVVVACTQGAASAGLVGNAYGLTLSPGVNGNQLDRRMRHTTLGSQYEIHYQVHSQASCVTPVWGDGSNGTVELTGTLANPAVGPTNTTHTVRVCMSDIGQSQSVTSPQTGDYADFLQITLHL